MASFSQESHPASLTTKMERVRSSDLTSDEMMIEDYLKERPIPGSKCPSSVAAVERDVQNIRHSLLYASYWIWHLNKSDILALMVMGWAASVCESQVSSGYEHQWLGPLNQTENGLSCVWGPKVSWLRAHGGNMFSISIMTYYIETIADNDGTYRLILMILVVSFVPFRPHTVWFMFRSDLHATRKISQHRINHWAAVDIFSKKMPSILPSHTLTVQNLCCSWFSRFRWHTHSSE